MPVQLHEIDFSEFILEIDYRRFFGLKDDNGGNADSSRRVLQISSAALERVRELRKSGWSDDQIEDDLRAAVGHMKLDLGFLARNG